MSLSTCEACPRLVACRHATRREHPDWHAAPVAATGEATAPLLLVGLAPGFRGAHRTGVPFEGDESGRWLRAALGGRAVRITNAVKCFPPENRPTPLEIATCRERWLAGELAEAAAATILALGVVAWSSVLAVAGVLAPFVHGARVEAVLGGRPRTLVASYHPSPLNTRTGRLTPAAFSALLPDAA